jgi:bacterioferritin-associated ferredoxin
MIVCVCNRLNDVTIRQGIAAGARKAEDVYGACGAKRKCGRCQDTIAEMLVAEQAKGKLRAAA